MAWIAKVEVDNASGGLKQEYEAAVKRAGRVYEILKVQSLKPSYITSCLGIYRESMFGPSKLTRIQREMVAVVVSATNGCHY